MTNELTDGPFSSTTLSPSPVQQQGGARRRRGSRKVKKTKHVGGKSKSKRVKARKTRKSRR